MKIKLGYKIFVAFLLTAFVVVALMVGTMRYSLSRHFADYVNNRVLDNLDALTIDLALMYEKHQGWRELKENPDLWQDVLLAGLEKSRESGRADSPETKNPDAGTASREASQNDRSRRLGRLAQGLALFDLQKRYIAGRPVTRPDGFTLRAITVNDNTVGWLGLHKREHLSSPLSVRFLKEQSLVFYEIGVGILLLAAIVSFMLSKHLLAPIRELTEGTRALREFNFDAKIDVRTEDELGRLASDFNQMADTLKKYEAMRRRWISDISHELRTPLAILKGEIEALQDGVRKPGRQAFDSLHSEVSRLGRLVEDLHLLSLADSNSLLFKTDPVDPFEVLREMAAHYRGRLSRKQIDLRFDSNVSGPVIMKGDSDRLAQLFSNLLENSLRYTDSPGRLIIRGRHGPDKAWIEFEDSAPGVPQEALELLFDRLYRVDKSRSRELGGSGLGLAICKEIVEAHGGTIRAADAASGGLLIRVELPLETADPGKGSES